MKITAVQGTPTIPQAPSTGVAPDKLARLKAIAAGQPPPEEEEQKEIPASQVGIPRIKMNVTREADPNSEGPLPVTAESSISDTNEQTNVVPEATEPLSPQLAALAKQRRAVQVKETEIAKREQALLEREKAQTGPTRSELEAKLKSHALSTLQELGITYDQLTQEILNAQQGITPEISALQAEVKALREGFDEKLTTRDAAAEKAVLGEMKRNVDSLSFSGDDFELIRETKSQQAVVDRIHEKWKETGEVIDELDMMQTIENELAEEMSKLARLKKIQGKLSPIETPLQQQQPQGMRTLTNKDQAAPTMSRRARAIAAANGTLKR
jgi:hypothetical protein